MTTIQVNIHTLLHILKILSAVLLTYAIVSCNYKSAGNHQGISDSTSIITQSMSSDTSKANSLLEGIIEKLCVSDFLVQNRSKNISEGKLLINNNFINYSIRFNNENEISDTPIEELNLIGLNEIEIIKFKSTNRIEGDIYPKLTLEVWGFNSPKYRDLAKHELDKLSEREWFFISKNRILYWCLEDNSIIFLSASASYFDQKLEEIKRTIQSIPSQK